MSTTSYGLCFHRDEPAATVIERSQAAEAGGFDEFWLIEDCFYTAGISLAATALAVTSYITVGVGILPVVARNAAVTAMEIATLAEIAPGRFHAGLGHGVQDWMRQMDAAVASPLTVLEETFDAVRRLLAGDIVGGDHRITVFASLAMGPTEAHADIRAGMAGYLAEVAGDGAEGTPISLKMAPFFRELAAQAAASSWFEAAASMPDEWLTQIAAFGTPDQAAGYVESLVAAGADAVAFFPNPEDALSDGGYTSRELLPLLR
jgi:alkanesulfonate monooxygenase SsuD/methylene tetrahydromethanopterin reductase-like flavin-dependent oxidoreductase (luciferase family)